MSEMPPDLSFETPLTAQLRARRAQTDAILAREKAERQQARAERQRFRGSNAPQPSSQGHGAQASLPNVSPFSNMPPVPKESPTTKGSQMPISSPQILTSPAVVPSQVKSLSAVINPKASHSPAIIPENLPYEIQEEPSRLEINPLQPSIMLPLPVPNPSVTPSSAAATLPTQASQQKVTLEVQNLGPMVFAVPLSMPTRIQSQYLDTISYYRTAIETFANTKNPASGLVDLINTLLDRLGRVATHVDLEGSGPLSQEPADADTEAEYAQQSSEKFRFLGQLLALLRDQDLHIAIVARPGQLLDILGTFLKANGVLHGRAGTMTGLDPPITGNDGRLKVSLLPSGAVGVLAVKGVDLVVAFDETFNTESPQTTLLRRAQSLNSTIERLSPVIHLVVYSSVEHLDLCLPRSLDPIDRLRKLVFSILQTRLKVGILEFDEPKSSACAIEVAKFLRGEPHEATWTVPPLRPIHDIEFMESDSALSEAMSDVSDEYKPEEAPRCWPNPIPAKLVSTQNHGKRSFDLEYGDSLEIQAKKQKLSEKANSDCTENPREPTLRTLQQSLHESHHREQSLTTSLTATQSSLSSHQSWLEKRQQDYEVLRSKAGALEVDKHELTIALTGLQKNREAQLHDIQALKETRTRLETELAQTRSKLVSHPNPAVATTEREAARLRTLEAEVMAKQRRIDSLTKEFEFTRLQYQSASTAAASSATAIAELQSQIPLLESRASENMKIMREQRDRDENAALRKEVNRLREEVKSRERLVVKKEERIRELERGRGVQTRGSSAKPEAGRSPRGSRGVSPAVGGSGMGVGGVAKALSGLGSRFQGAS